MIQRFNTSRMWVWILNFIVYIGVVITYFLVPGHEIIYSMYIPLDVLLNISKAIYYFYCYYKDSQQKKKQQEMADALKSQVKNALAAGMLSIMGRKKADEDAGGVDTETSKRAMQLKVEYQEVIYLQQKRNKLLDEVTAHDKELDMDLDTYSMAFRALLWDTIKEIELKENEVHEAF